MKTGFFYPEGPYNKRLEFDLGKGRRRKSAFVFYTSVTLPCNFKTPVRVKITRPTGLGKGKSDYLVGKSVFTRGYKLGKVGFQCKGSLFLGKASRLLV